MGYAYAAKASAVTPPTTPTDWPTSWPFPTNPGTTYPPIIAWPPGWPIDDDSNDDGASDYTISVDIPATVSVGGSVALVATILDGGIDTADLNLHLVAVRATLNGATLQLKNSSGDSYTDVIWFQVSNYSGSSYGISSNIYLNTSSGDAGGTVSVSAEVYSVSPTFSGSDTSSVVNPELLVAVGSSGTNRVMTSNNGTSWTARTAAEQNLWSGVDWSPALGLYCAVSLDGTHRVMTSPDGINWTARTAAEQNAWSAIKWSPSLAIFCAISRDGTHRVMTSPDGINWTAQTAASASAWEAIDWSPALGLFVAVAPSAFMSSSDGINWTSRTPAVANSWGNVAWGASAGKFVAANEGFVTEVINYSTDGINWNNTVPGLGGQNWRCIRFGAGVFCCASDGASSPRFMTSPDAITWTARTPANTCLGLEWSASLGLFIGVGASVGQTSIDGITWASRSVASGNWTWVCARA